MSKKDGAGKRAKAQRFEVEDWMSPGDVAGYLEGLAKGLREGAVVLGEQGESFRAAVSEDVEMKVEARHGKRRSRINLRLRFRRASDENDATETQEAGAQPESLATIPDEMRF